MGFCSHNTLVVTHRDVNIHPGCWSGYYRANRWQVASRRVVHGVLLSCTTADTDSTLYYPSLKIRDRCQSLLSLTNYAEKKGLNPMMWLLMKVLRTMFGNHCTISASTYQVKYSSENTKKSFCYQISFPFMIRQKNVFWYCCYGHMFIIASA